MEHTLVVASRKRWVADDLTEGAPDGVSVRHDIGLDAPAVTGRNSWWTPSAHAARICEAGVPMNLSAPGPAWLTRVDTALTGRYIWAGTLDDITNAPRAGYAKPAEAKNPELGAAWYDDITVFAELARNAGMPPDSWIQVADRRLDIISEHRCFITGDRVSATCAYLDGAGNTYDDGWEHDDRFDNAGADEFTTTTAASFGEDRPYAYSLDVAKLADGTFIVLEANPSWCAGFYGCDLEAVAASVVASSDSAADHGEFAWRADPYLTGEARRQRTLASWVPAWERPR